MDCHGPDAELSRRGALADMAVGVGIGFRRTCRAAILMGIAVTFQAVAGTIVRPPASGPTKASLTITTAGFD